MEKIISKKMNKPYMAELSQKWLDVLIPFSNEYSKKLSGSEISRIVKFPQRSISRYLTELVNNGILKFEEKGNNKLYFLDLSDEKIRMILNLIESYKAFVFSQNNLIWKDLKELVNFGTFVVFGSQVKGYSNMSSDIDLVLFSKKSEKLKGVLRNILKVQAQVISFDNFEKLVLKKDVLALEILKNHIIFGDIDKFVSLCWRFYYG